MRIGSSSENRPQKAEDGEKPEKKSKSKSTTTKKGDDADDAKDAKSAKDSKGADKKKQVAGASTPGTEDKKVPSTEIRSNNGADTEVVLSAKGKEKSQADRELTQAETLMQHINSGKLGEEERANALSRVGEIVRKYGTA